MIKLGRGLVVDRGPGFAAIERHTGSSIMAHNDALGIVGIDPQVVVITVRRGDPGKGIPAIVRFKAAFVEHPHGLRVLWVGKDVLVVPGTLAQVRLLAESLPRVTSIVGAEDRPILGLDGGPDTVCPRSRNGYANLANHARGQPWLVCNLCPAIAPVA